MSQPLNTHYTDGYWVFVYCLSQSLKNHSKTTQKPFNIQCEMFFEGFLIASFRSKIQTLSNQIKNDCWLFAQCLYYHQSSNNKKSFYEWLLIDFWVIAIHKQSKHTTYVFWMIVVIESLKEHSTNSCWTHTNSCFRGG